jgi:post-segregation antitoxin (ccd killing protein)
MGRMKRAVSEMSEELRERAKDVRLNISAIKQNAVAQNRRTRKVRQILTVKGNGAVLEILCAWGLQSVIL